VGLSIMCKVDMCIAIIKEKIDKNEDVVFTVFGDSMLPSINNGEKVIIKKCDTYKIGDIVAYYIKDESKYDIIVHRLVFVRKSYFLAKGDNNSFLDPIRINIDNVIGKVSTNGNFKMEGE